jgi:hypothetical protein
MSDMSDDMTDMSDDEADAMSGASTARARRRPEPHLPMDVDDPFESPDPLSETTRHRLDRLFAHLGPTGPDTVRPQEPEWRPDKSVEEWARIVWESVPGALRWWVESVEVLAPGPHTTRCLHTLQQLIVEQSDEERFSHIRSLFLSQGCPP